MVVFDTSAWVEYFLGSKRGLVAKKYVESEQEVFTPTVCLAELKLKYAREMPEQLGGCIGFVLNRSVYQQRLKTVAASLFLWQ